jgi:hypothetical protein
LANTLIGIDGIFSKALTRGQDKLALKFKDQLLIIITYMMYPHVHVYICTRSFLTFPDATTIACHTKDSLGGFFLCMQ